MVCLCEHRVPSRFDQEIAQRPTRCVTSSPPEFRQIWYSVVHRVMGQSQPTRSDLYWHFALGTCDEGLS